MATDILQCNYFQHVDNSTKVMFQNSIHREICKYDYKHVLSKTGKHKNDNKTILPYVDKIVN